MDGKSHGTIGKAWKSSVIFEEEAIGFCIGDIVRDKDGVVAAVAFSEMAQYLKMKNKYL